MSTGGSNPASRPTTPGGSVVPFAPVFKVSLKENVQLLNGTTVRFEIVAQGAPAPTLTFYKNDEILEQDERVRVIYEKPEVLELVLDSVTAEDSGIYKVVATNCMGEAETSGTIEVVADKVLFPGLEEGDEATGAAPVASPENKNLLGVEGESGDSRPLTPLFRWFRDGGEFQASERFQCQFDDSEDTIALVFQHVTPEDAGLYTCVANTTSGKISCSAELTVQGDVHRLLRTPEPPTVQAEIAPVEANEGSSAMIDAKVSGYPLPKVQWYHDNEEVLVDDRHKVLKEDEESYTLVIKNVQATDAGTYLLKAENDLGGVETSGTLSVNSAPKIRRQMEGVTTMADHQVKLELQVDASPAPVIKWYKDGQLIEASGRIKVLSEANGSYSLVIDKASTTDTGSYSCVISNKCGQQTAFANVQVTAPPKFETTMTDYNGHAGDTAEFKVKVTGSPKPQVLFQRNGQQITADDRINVVEEEDGTYVLTIKGITATDTGTYSCTATNQHGSKEAQAQLGIRAAPSFKRRLSDFEARDGDVNVEFTVILEGSPSPKVKWQYETTELKESEQYKFIEQSDGTRILRITKAGSEMTGKYTCTATNEEGEASTSCKLTVAAKPSFREGLKDQQIGNGGTLSFKLKLAGEPKPELVWTRNGEPITIDGQRIKLVADEGSMTYTLTIDNCTADDIGEYRVNAMNVLGEASSSAKAIMAIKPKITAGLKDINATQDQTGITLTVETDSTAPPPTSIRWFIDDIEIVEIDKRYQLKPDPDNRKFSLAIGQANEGTCGEYKVVVSNPVGQDSSSCQVALTAAPQFMQGLEDREAKEGDLIEMEIVAQGSPKPQLKLFKDGKELSLGESGGIKVEQESDLVYIVTIAKASRESGGVYEAVLSNKVGESRSKGTLSVLTKPMFVQDLMDSNAMEGEDSFIEVIVDANPRASITWFRDGNPIPTTVMKEHQDNKYRLRFEPVEPADNAEYHCQAKNPVGSAKSRTAKFVVQPAGDKKPPTFERPLAPLAVVGGDAVRMECKVAGVPAPHVQWLKDGQEIQDQRLVIKDEGGGDHSMTIRRSQETDAGMYSVVAKNSSGEAKTEAKLDIQKAQQPTVEGLKDIEVEYLTGGQFEVQISGVPTPQVHWLKDGKEIQADDNVSISVNGDTHRLSIRMAGEMNAGKYNVQASNSAGVAGAHASLTIAPRAPKFLSGTGPYIVDLNSPCNIEVHVTGYPHPTVTWERKVAQGSSSPVTHGITQLGENHRLSFMSISAADLGTYVVKAVNASGEATAEISVGLGETKPSMLKNLTPTLDLTGGDVLRLEGKVSGNPLPDIKWLRDGIELVLDDRMKIERFDDGRVVLTIRDVTPEDAGRYELVAVNSSGKTSSTSKVRISPKFEMRERKKVVREDFHFESKTHYENGPDTYLLQHRDVDYPLRIREYLRVGASRSVSLAKQLQEGHWGDINLGYGFSPQVAVRERRKFVHIMDEEIDDEKAGRDTRLTPMRLVREIGTGGYAYGQIHTLRAEAKGQMPAAPVKMQAATWREKIKDTAAREEEAVTLSCYAVGEPKPTYNWFRNDTLIVESSRVRIVNCPDGRCQLQIKAMRAYDVGCYKCVARNVNGAAVCRAKLKLGAVPAPPVAPVAESISDTKAYVTWAPPRVDGNLPVMMYQLEYQRNDQKEWTTVAETIPQEYFVITNLEPSQSYVARVRARNRLGWSEWAISHLIKTKATGAEDAQLSVPKSRQPNVLRTDATMDEPELIPDVDYFIEEQPLQLQSGDIGELVTVSDQLARGRFAVVSFGTLKATGQKCVVKSFQTELGQREFELFKSLANERIVRILAATSNAKLTALALEPLSGLDVLSFLSQRGQYSEENVSKCIQDILDALEYLHTRGICILELQPDNVVAIHPRRVDFKITGLAKARRVPAAGAKATLDPKAEPEYLAPEIIKEQDVTVATDVWCVGILTYILLSGFSPFRGATAAESSDNVSFVRYHFDHLYPQVTQEAIRFLMLIFKRTPSKRPTLEECSDHKWLLPDDYMTKKRENAVFSAQALMEFSEDHHARRAAATPQELLSISGN